MGATHPPVNGCVTCGTPRAACKMHGRYCHPCRDRSRKTAGYIKKQAKPATIASWYKRHPEKAIEYQARYRTKHRDKVRERARQFSRKRSGNPRWLAMRRAYRAKVKLEVLSHYSNGTLTCACCPETQYKFLSLDHIAGGGRKHAQQVGGGSNMYKWLKARRFPPGLQVLCFNCNMAKGFYGACPHKDIVLAAMGG